MNVSSSPPAQGVSRHSPSFRRGEAAEKTAAVQSALAQLQSTDSKVRSHEAAHVAAGGGVVTGGANFSYTRGPDGKLYATGGEVPIDTSEGKNPSETIQKARQIAAAAMAPSDPSPQDYKVAATATMMEMRAHLEETKALQDALQGRQAYGITSTVPSPPLSAAASPERQ